MDSEDDAQELLNRGEAKTFGMRDWTYDRELLTLLIDEVRGLHSTFVAAHSKNRKGFKVQPLPRPVTALDRVKRKQRWERYEELVAKVLPPDAIREVDGRA